MPAPPGFAELLSPLGLDRFFADHWERAPLHLSRNDPAVYASIITPRAVDDAIASGGLRHPSIQLARDGMFLPPETFTHRLRSGGDTFDGIPDLGRIQAEYDRGATISLPGFQRAAPGLARLTDEVEAVLSHPAHANAYLTPPGAAGFAAHYDTHDVFVLQIAGRKTWRIQRPPLPLPHRSMPFDPRRTPTDGPADVLALAPGDLLYLPRGYVHDTRTGAEPSLHVTLGVTVFTFVELVTDWAQSSRGAEAFRRALPRGFADGVDGRRALADEVRRLAARLEEEVDVDAWLDDFIRRVRSARAAKQGGFSSAPKPRRP